MDVKGLSGKVLDDAREELRGVFDGALLKWESRIEKRGNTLRPWFDFDALHLSRRLREEFEEWSLAQSQDVGLPFEQQELLDIINVAAFLYLRNFRDDCDEFGRKKDG